MSTPRPRRFDMRGDALEVEHALDRLRTLHRSARALAGGRDVELYQRATRLIRATRSRDRPTHWNVGLEEGLAVRVRSGARTGFATRGGSSEQAMRWALARAVDGCSTGVPGDWHRPLGPESLLDHRGTSDLPDPLDLEAWLAEAMEDLVRVGASRNAEVVEGWVEVAATVESWCADGGLAASRARSRCWALATLRIPDSDPRPVVVAWPRVEDLETHAWRQVVEDRCFAQLSVARTDTRMGPVLFNPEATAHLVSALVNSIHGSEESLGGPVGPGWRIHDEPAAEAALSGGIFDDAGFPSSATCLADGARVTGIIAGPGHLRRPSYRDLPVPRPAHLRVELTGVQPPARFALVSGIVVHPLGVEGWILEAEGAWMEHGASIARLRGLIRVIPTELIQRCLGSVGPPRASHRGVLTPALLFEGLEVRDHS